MLTASVVDFAFEHVAAIDEQAPVESQAVGHARLRGAGIPHGPSARVEFVHPAPRVASNVGWIVPCTVVHGAPSQELRARIVAIAVVVEEIGNSEAPGSDTVAGHRPCAR